MVLFSIEAYTILVVHVKNNTTIVASMPKTLEFTVEALKIITMVIEYKSLLQNKSS